ncbi:hypothetical protein [Rubrobacter calidifluminis]|uniref:hypothetical protein n=1 Tax=Rubrobacter calidifluminis TaxID=1392640 RepID=UPI0023605FB5|nr:hypothetical protein [Rubrobacter calidifluminis]
MSPRDLYIGGTLASIAISLGLFARGRRNEAIFVGLWAPTVLQLGEALLARSRES